MELGCSPKLWTPLTLEKCLCWHSVAAWKGSGDPKILLHYPVILVLFKEVVFHSRTKENPAAL
jgi:hypothetical protein